MTNGTGYLRIDITHQHHHDGDQRAPSLYSQVNDFQRTLKAIRDHSSPEDLTHIKCVHLAEPKLTFKEPLINKIEIISQGNSKSFNKNPVIIQKTMNTEDRYSHVVPHGRTNMSIISISTSVSYNADYDNERR